VYALSFHIIYVDDQLRVNLTRQGEISVDIIPTLEYNIVIKA